MWRITIGDFDVGVIVGSVERVRVVWWWQWQQTGLWYIILVLTLRVLGTRRVKVYRSQEQWRRTLATFRQTTLPARRLPSSVTDQCLPVNTQRHTGADVTVTIVTKQYRPCLLGARVVRRQVRRVPRLSGDVQLEIGQGTELGVVEVVKQRDDGRLENG